MPRTVSVVVFAALAACNNTPSTDADPVFAEPGDVEPLAPTHQIYAHPLQDTRPLPDGRLPFVDVKRSPDGKAYALGEGGGGPEEGREESFSGVVELPVRSMTADERSVKPARERSEPALVLDVTFRERLASGPLDGELPVKIHLRGRPAGTVTQHLERAVAEGRIVTAEDRERVRAERMEELALELAPRVDELAERVAALGGEVSYRCVYQPCVTATLPAKAIARLAADPDIQRIGMLEPSQPDNLNGMEKADTYQTRLFWDETFDDGGVSYDYDGNNGQSTDIRVAVLDDEGFRTSHVAFREDAGGSRIDGLWDCRTPPCVSVGSFTGISDHGTAVLGTLLGDYRDGQDPAVATTTAREQRSAPGGEAKAYVYWSDRSQGDQQAVYDSIVNRSPAPHLLVSSNSVGSATDCSGEDTKAVGADGVYESGIAYFKSANNFGGSSTNCNVGPPGEAIGVFTVAGFDAPTTTDVCDMKAAPIHASSGWGGSTSVFDEGKYRSIIGLTGSYQGSTVPWFSSDTATGTFTGTSHAAPSVASTAVNFLDMMKNLRGSTLIDDPGVLYAWMLNMGDRRDQNGSLMSTRFDHRTGAGNLRMRFIGNAGMDTPWYWYHYSTCIDDGEVYTIDINGGAALSSDVDSLRAVAWWYDRRIEDGTDIDDIDLRLETTGGTSLSNSIDAYDNKERVFSQGVGGQAVRLQVTGYDVTADDEGCGTDSMRVFVTVLVEDDDRDDGDGPDYDPATCVGVDPL